MWFGISVVAVGLVLGMAARAAAGPPAGFNYDEAKVRPYVLPDPLTCLDGTKVKKSSTWAKKRRPEVLELFTTEVFGRPPEVRARPVFQVVETDQSALNGKATRKQIAIWLLGTNGGPRLDLLLYIPNHAGPRVPAFLGLNFGGNHAATTDPAVLITTNRVATKYATGATNRATGELRGMQASRWPIDLIVSNGYAVATACYGDLEVDSAEGWKTGIRGVLAGTQSGNPFKPDDWGAISAWAWGLSRAMDYLQTDPRINPRQVAVIGHSRLGKTALWAGARDQRFAVVISNNSGEGGAALARRNFGETTARINQNFPHWFCGNYKKYGGKEDALPVDAHLLIALCAPRPVYVASAQDDSWADPRGEFLALKGAEPVYRLYGVTGFPPDDMPPANTPVGDALGYHIRDGGHGITAYDWAQYLRFADRNLKGTSSRRQ